FRPESLEVVSADTQPGGFPATVQVVEELGSDAFCYTTLPGHDAGEGAGGVDVIARVDARTPPQKGETLHLRIRPEEAHAFSTVTGNRLPSCRSLHRRPPGSPCAGGLRRVCRSRRRE